MSDLERLLESIAREYEADDPRWAGALIRHLNSRLLPLLLAGQAMRDWWEPEAQGAPLAWDAAKQKALEP